MEGSPPGAGKHHHGGADGAGNDLVHGMHVKVKG